MYCLCLNTALNNLARCRIIAHPPCYMQCVAFSDDVAIVSVWLWGGGHPDCFARWRHVDVYYVIIETPLRMMSEAIL
jgi:hypothetical protein